MYIYIYIYNNDNNNNKYKYIYIYTYIHIYIYIYIYGAPDGGVAAGCAGGRRQAMKPARGLCLSNKYIITILLSYIIIIISNIS